MFGRISSKVNGNQYMYNNNDNNNNDNSSFMKINYYRPTQSVSNPVSIPIPIPETPPQKKMMKWGQPTWFLLHTLAEKVKDEHFSRIKNDLFRNIYTICTNLPCPDCANHAKLYLDSINFSLIQSRHDLKNMLFVFHNSVNKRKGFPIFLIEELNDKYVNAVTVNIINNFIFYFSDKSRSPQMIAGDLYRSRLTGNIKDWLNQNLYCFNH